MRTEPAYSTMDIQSNNVVESCHQCYQNVINQFDTTSGDESLILVSHFGEFSQDLVNSLSMKVEETLLEAGVKKGIVKRMFSILVEGLQNIRIHGERDQDGNQLSFLIIVRKDDAFKIILGNLLRNNYVENIKGRIDALNEMDPAEVKERYMEVLTNGIMSNKGGAGLGFITIAMKSKSNLDYEMVPLDDDLTCFVMSTNVEEKQKD